MKKENKWTKWLYYFSLAVCVVVVYKTLDSFPAILGWFRTLLDILMPFILGVLIAYLFYLPCKTLETWYQKRKAKLLQKKARIFSIITVYVIAIIAIILVCNFVLPAVMQSIVDLANQLPGYYQSAIDALQNLPEDNILHKLDIASILDEVEGMDLKQFFRIETITGYLKSAVDFVSGIFGLFVAIVTSIYLLYERNQILQFAKKVCHAIFKTATYQRIGKYFSKTNEIFLRFISSQFLDAIIIGILVSIAMLLLNVKYAVLLGFLIGLSNMIPYWGAIIGVGISIIITIFTGGIGQAIWMGIIVIILQQIDANIINPKIVGSSLKISPLLVIFAVTVGGAYFGILGMFLAVPVFTVIKIFVSDYVEYKNKEKSKKEPI